MITDDHTAGLLSRAVIRYEVALDVMDTVIAHYAEEVGIENSRSVLAEAKLRQAMAEKRAG